MPLWDRRRTNWAGEPESEMDDIERRTLELLNKIERSLNQIEDQNKRKKKGERDDH